MRTGRWNCRLKRPALAILVLGLLLSCALFLLMLGHQQQIERDIFERRTQSRIVALQQGIGAAIDTLRVVNQLFVTNDHVSREQFHTFTAPLLLRHAYIDAFAFSRMIAGSERTRFEASMSLRFPGYAIRDMIDGRRTVAAVRDHYRVIDYLEPPERNNDYFGIDALSQPFAVDAIRRAEETGLPSATALFKRTMDPGTQHSLRIVMPVYRKTGNAEATAPHPDTRRAALLGYTVAVLRSRDLFDNILASADHIGNTGIDISIYASTIPSAGAGALVYGTADAARHQQTQVRWWEHRMQPISHPFDVAGTEWRMVISQQPMALSAIHAGALTALLMGLLTTFAACAYLQSMTLRAQQVQQLVAARTDELKQVNALLMQDIDARKQVEEALRESRLQLRKLANHQESVKEDERKRIARDIHDELGQNLIALRIDVALMARPLAPPSKQWLAGALQQIDATIKSVRTIINDLRPAVLDLGLPAALEWQVSQFKRRSGIDCQLQIDHDEFALNDKYATTLFRIVQEALTNILKHAKASHVQIRMQCLDDSLFVQIADDGIGIGYARQTHGFGLVGMEERIYALGGTFSIDSAPGQGTTILVSIPCDISDTSAAHMQHGDLPAAPPER
jgi:signal transduction histidine kinase